MSRIAVLCIAAMSMAVCLGGAGCASTACDLKPVGGTSALPQARTIYVEKVTAAEGVAVPDGVLADATGKIVSDLNKEKRFTEVTQTPPSSGSFVRLSGRITQYEPGDRFLRAMLIGLGTATLKMDVTASDGPTGAPLAKGDLTEFWGWGGLMGASRGIEDMMNSACDHVAGGTVTAFAGASK